MLAELPQPLLLLLLLTSSQHAAAQMTIAAAAAATSASARAGRELAATVAKPCPNQPRCKGNEDGQEDEDDKEEGEGMSRAAQDIDDKGTSSDEMV
jgi:hypothetical protein